MTRDVLVLKDKKFISAGRAAEISGYTSDYIGQLCRAGKLDCAMLGRGWFVTEDSLSLHKHENGNGVRGGSKYFSPSSPQVISTAEVSPHESYPHVPESESGLESGSIASTSTAAASVASEERITQFIPDKMFTPEDQWKIALTARFYSFLNTLDAVRLVLTSLCTRDRLMRAATFAAGTITLCIGITLGCPGSIPSC